MASGVAVGSGGSGGGGGDHTSGKRVFKNSTVPCQENNVFRLLGGLSQAVLSVAPNTPRRGWGGGARGGVGVVVGGRVMKSNRHFPFKVEEACVAAGEPFCLSKLPLPSPSPARI